MRITGHVDAGNGEYGASAYIVETEPHEGVDIIEKRSFTHLQKWECDGRQLTSAQAAVAWCIQRGACKVTVTSRHTAGEFPHCKHARLMHFDTATV